MNDNEESYMTQKQVAEYISKLLVVAYRVVYERWVHFPDFPRAVTLPTIGKIPRKRWVRSEIMEWTESRKRAA